MRAANCSHFVGSLGAGRGFSRGRGVVGAGRERRTPEVVVLRGHVVRSWFMRACAPSRAVAASCASRAVELVVGDSAGMEVLRGFGSLARRRPRSKVYGVGLVTETSSLGLEVVVVVGGAIVRVVGSGDPE